MNYVLSLIGLFVVLSPGLLLTLPALSHADAKAKGISYASSAGASGVATGPTNDADVCDSAANFTDKIPCGRATRVWNSEETSTGAVLIHALIFAAAVVALQQTMPQVLSPQPVTVVVLFAVAFAVLSPGFLVTLPALSTKECGTGGRYVANNNNFCDSPSLTTLTVGTPCQKCTSFWLSGSTSPLAIIVHGILFGILVYWLSGSTFVQSLGGGSDIEFDNGIMYE